MIFKLIFRIKEKQQTYKNTNTLFIVISFLSELLIYSHIRAIPLIFSQNSSKIQTYYLHMRMLPKINFKTQQLDHECIICWAISINEMGRVFKNFCEDSRK